MTSQFTPYLLDSSLIDYTVAVTGDALRVSDSGLKEQTKKRAARALEFFLNTLDPSIEEEQGQLQVFQKYHAALSDNALAKTVLESLSVVNADGTEKIAPGLNFFELSPSQKVLSLQETLEAIFSHLPLLTKYDRDTYYNASLTSHAFHNVAQLGLWRHPRDLDTVEQQVRFAFGTAISRSFGKGLGNYVKRLRIRIVKGAWNMRIVEMIASLTPALEDLTFHWGDTEDSPEEVTNEVIQSIHNILSSLPSLKHLYLGKFSYTPDIEGELTIPRGADGPFSNLESLGLYGFHWYWKPISCGLTRKLKSLDLGFATLIDSDEVVELSSKLSGLTTLVLSIPHDIDELRTIIENIPGLEKIDLGHFSEVDDTYSSRVIYLLATLKSLRSITLNITIEAEQLDVLATSAAPLENLYLTLQGGENVEKELLKLLKAKGSTLKNVSLSFEEDFILAPTNDIVRALAGIPQLEKIGINFQTGHQLDNVLVDLLLRNCPHLNLTDELETLVTGNALYEAEYRTKLKKAREELDKDVEEDILGN